MTPPQSFKQTHEVRTVRSLVRARTEQARDWKARIDTCDVRYRGRFELERRRVLAEVGDLDDAFGAAAPGEEKGLIALAAEVLRITDQSEELSRDRGDFIRIEPRRHRVKHRRHVVPYMSTP